MKACRVAIILATTFSAVNAVALQAASNDICSDCDGQPPRFELGVSASGIHLPDNNNFGLGARAVFTSIHFSLLKAREISSSIMHHQNFSAEDVLKKGCLVPKLASERKTSASLPKCVPE